MSSKPKSSRKAVSNRVIAMSRNLLKETRQERPKGHIEERENRNKRERDFSCHVRTGAKKRRKKQKRKDKNSEVSGAISALHAPFCTVRVHTPAQTH